MASGANVAPSGRRPFRQFFADLGPGLVTGAADDDPSGISTYSVAGATLGYAPLWTALFSFPLMAGVQLMCARLGLVTGRGLAGVIRQHFPRWVLWSACGMLVAANVINIAADLGGMAEATTLVTGLPAVFWLPIYAAIIVTLLVWSSYRTIARIFKWMTLVLAAYVATAFMIRVDWPSAVAATFVPRVQLSHRFFSVLVGIFGTTISPYLFFWQAAQEVEEERALGRNSHQRRGATPEELRAARTDVVIGMFASNAIMYFIILTTAATLHASGRAIATARDAAAALLPLAGDGAYWLFALGLIGTGMLAVPVLGGSCAYAIAEAAAWREQSLASPPRHARKFYVVIAVSVVTGLMLDYFHFDAIRLLFATAVINGVLAPPLVLIVVLLTRNRAVMGDAVNPAWLDALGWITFVVMVGAALGLLLN